MADWCQEQIDGLTVLRCDALAGIRGLQHAFSTRISDDPGDGDAGFDLGPAASNSPMLLDRRRRFARAAGVGFPIAAPLQVHGVEILEAASFAGTGAEAPPEGDGVVSRPGDLPAAVRTADCVPLLLADRRGGAVAAIHAGWRGTAAGIAREAVRRMQRAGCAPDRLIALLGPAIGPCCYEVSPEVARQVATATGADLSRVTAPKKPRNLDLHAANRLQLEAAGLPLEAIHEAPGCTRCTLGPLFHSYRRDGERAGRMLACIGLSAPSGGVS